MSRNASGTYSLPAGNPVQANTLIESNNWANPTMNDLGAEITDSLSRDGKGSMRAELGIVDGLEATPGWRFNAETGSGAFRTGAGDWGLTVLGVEVLKMTTVGVTLVGGVLSPFVVTLGAGSGAVAPTVSDDIVIDADANAGFSILVGDANVARFNFGSLADPNAAVINYQPALTKLTVGTSVVAGIVDINTGDSVFAVSIDDSQNVGIGVAAPLGRLHVAGGALLLDTAVPNIEFRDTSITANFQILVDLARMDFKVDDNDAFVYPDTIMSLTENRQVGIGVTNPIVLLQLVADVDPTIMLHETASGTSSNIQMRFISTGQSAIDVATLTGSSLLDLNVNPADGTSSGNIRMFRNQLTTASSGLQIMAGDGTATVHAQIFGKTGTSFLGLGGGDFGVGTDVPTNNSRLHILGRPTFDDPVAIIESNDDNANIGPGMWLVRNRPGNAINGDQLASIDWRGKDTAGGFILYTRTATIADVATAGSTQGRWYVSTRDGANFPIRLNVRLGLYTANATGGDQGIDTINVSKYFTNGVEGGLVPAGSVVAFTLTTLPTGWVTCNGQAISRTTFATLFAVIGVIYGNGNGTTTFNVPDMRGEFIRGHDATAGNDPDAATRTDRGDGTTGDNVGTKQLDDFESHNHTANTSSGGAGGANKIPITTTVSVVVEGTVINVAGGNETRPRNIYFTWMIKT